MAAKRYKALVRDKQTQEIEFIESEYNSKASFIEDLRRNGYAVAPHKVQPAEAFDFVMNYTNCEPEDWKHAKMLYEKDTHGYIKHRGGN